MAGCKLARVGIRRRKQPQVHIPRAVGVEGYHLTVRRPCPPAIFPGCADYRFRRPSNQSSLREDWKLPDVGILMQRGKSEALAIGRGGHFNVLSGTCGHLLWRPAGG